MRTEYLWCLGLVLNYVTFVPSSASLEDAVRLHDDLLANYSKYVRPVGKQEEPVNVYISLAAIAIQEFDEVLERFSVAGALFLNWVDENMRWDEKDYDDVETVFMGYKHVWVPEIILTNPSEKLDSFGKEWQLIRYGSSGFASWTPGDLIKATCSIDVRFFPFDTQECDLDMYVWGYLTTEVKLISTSDKIDTGLMSEHGSWKVVSTSVKTEDVAFVSKIIFTFRLQRKPQYVVVNVVLPILFLCLLNVLVFILPAESGERMSYAITVLLSIAVFMTIVSDTLPKTSEPLPIIGYFLMIDLIISALISVFTVLNLRTYHKKDDVPVPSWLSRVYDILSCKCRRRVSVASSTNFKDESGSIIPLAKSKDRRNAFVDHDSDIKQIHMNAHIDNSLDSNQTGNKITWQDISTMFDYILFIAFTFFTIASFAAFLIITLGRSN